MSIVHVAFYPSDWLAGTRGLSAEESGVYITLVCHMYEMAGPIERDDHRLSRMCGCRNVAAFRKCLDYLMAQGKITETGGGLFNDRASREIKNATGKSEKAKQAAERRWSKKGNKNNDRTNADALQTDMPGECYPESESYTEDTGVSSYAREKPKRKHKIREDAEITDGMMRAAEKRGHSLQEAAAQFQRFKNDALAKGKTFLDWDRAFVTWLDSPYFRPITKPEGKPNDGEAAERARRAGERYEERQRTRGMDIGSGGNSVVPLLPARQSGGSA